MTWTINATLKVALAAGTRTRLLGGSIKLYDATPTLLATVPISAIVENGGGALTVQFTQNVAPVANGTAVRADYCAPDGTVDMTTGSVGTSGTDVVLGDLALTTEKRIDMASHALTLANLAQV